MKLRTSTKVLKYLFSQCNSSDEILPECLFALEFRIINSPPRATTDRTDFSVAISSSNFWHCTLDEGLQIFKKSSKRYPLGHCISKPLDPWQTKYFEQSSGWATKPVSVFKQNFVLSACGALHDFWMGTKIEKYH